MQLTFNYNTCQFLFCNVQINNLRMYIETVIVKKAVLQIRIRIQFGGLDPDPDRHWEYGYGSGSGRAKMNHKSEENSSFEVLDVLF